MLEAAEEPIFDTAEEATLGTGVVLEELALAVLLAATDEGTLDIRAVALEELALAVLLDTIE